MVNMNDVPMEDPLEMRKNEALKLDQEKMRLEEELKELLSVLSTNNVGMDEPLIDVEGYPRSDIDVYRVRLARNRIICVRNDLKNLMKKIEEHLSILHTQGYGSSNSGTTEVTPRGVPIARITSVSPNSPACEAGLKMGDYILSFGSISSENFTNVSDIANVVKHSINQLIKVFIERDDKIKKLYLKPHTWNGPGVLGCVISPYEQVER